MAPAGPTVDWLATTGKPSAPLRSGRTVVDVVATAEVESAEVDVEVDDGDDDDAADDGDPPEHAASTASAKSCAAMETVLTFVAVTAAIAALAWAVRFRPGRMAKDGSWFDCDYQVVDLTSPNRQVAAWRAGRAEVCEREIVVHVGPSRHTAALGEPLPVIEKLDAKRRRQSVFLLKRDDYAVTISVARGSASERRLDALIER